LEEKKDDLDFPPEAIVMPQANFPWKITFNKLYNNRFLIGKFALEPFLYPQNITLYNEYIE